MMEHVSHDQILLAVDALGVEMVELDAKALVTSISRAAIEWDHRPASEIIGRSFYEVWPELRDSAVAEAIASVSETGNPETVEVHFKGHSGAEKWTDTRVQRCGTGIALISTDISKQKEAELAAAHELKQLQNELIHISRVSAMGTMASTLAHELNQPLTAIANYLGGCQYILDQPELDQEEMRRAVGLAHESAERAGEVIRRIRLMVTKGEVIKEPVALSAIVDEALALGTMGVRKGQVDVVVNVDRGLQVIADVVQIQQVVMNLIRNAIDAMSESPRRELTIVACQIDGKVRIEICDTGKGVPASDRDRLFEAFFTTKKNGLGIGLVISRTIVEAHGGRIWADEALSGGANFIVELPAITHPD